MQKIKITKKAIKESFDKIIKVGYCELQTLLQTAQPFAYSSGTYGWGCDYYLFDDVIISTGYSPIGEAVNKNIIEKYEKLSKKLKNNYYIDYNYSKLDQKLQKLIQKFINEAKGGQK